MVFGNVRQPSVRVCSGCVIEGDVAVLGLTEMHHAVVNPGTTEVEPVFYGVGGTRRTRVYASGVDIGRNYLTDNTFEFCEHCTWIFHPCGT